MVQSLNISICVQGQESNEAQINAEEEPGQDARECQDEMEDEDDGEQQRRLPGVKSDVVAFVF